MLHPAPARPWTVGHACLLLTLASTMVAPGFIGASTAGPEWGVILAPTPGSVVRSGAPFEVRWSAVPAEVDELELLLEMDESAKLEVRLTPQLVASTRTHVWYVPDLPTQAARIRIRVGIGGHEIDGPASAPFTIVAARPGRVAPVHYHEGEWWTSRFPRSSSPHHRVPSGMAGTCTVSPEVTQAIAGCDPRPAGTPPPASERASRRHAPGLLTSTSPAPLTRLPREVPQRR